MKRISDEQEATMLDSEQVMHSGEKAAQGPMAVVSLAVYDWHALLSELEYIMKFLNRDTLVAVRLYEAIATQLNCGQDVIVHQYGEGGGEGSK